MNLVPSTTARVQEHTAAHINRQIRQRTEDSVAYFAEHPDEIDDRLEELDREWDIERMLEANAAASISLLGLTLGLTVDRRWLALPMGVAASCCSTRFRAGARPCRCFVVSASAPLARSTRSATP